MEECIEAPVTIDKIPATPHELRVLPFPVSDIKKELVQEIVQIKTEDITDEKFLESIRLTRNDTKNESEREFLESNSSESNLVINEDTVKQIHNEDNQDKASALADFIESNKLLVDYEAHITREPEIQTVDVAVPFAAKKIKSAADASHRYKCGVCFVRFSEKQKIKHHMATHAESEKCYCNCNGFSIPMSLAELQSHRHTRQYQINTSREKSFQCEECGEAFSTKMSFDEHRAQKSHRCPICTSLTFPSCIVVKHHQVRHHSDLFSCTRCGKLFNFLEPYCRHCTSCEYCVCEICDRLFKSSEILNKHVEMQHLNVDDMFNCHLCDRTFDSTDYDTHDCTAPLAPRLSRVKLPMSVREERIKYPWSVAVESQATRVDTTVALDTSEPDLTTFDKLSKSPNKHWREVEGVYPCEYCDRIYPWLRSLRRHVNVTHKNTKSYWCVKCLKVFRVKYSLDTHKCTTNKKFKRGIPVRCPVCLSRHHTAVALSKHLIQYHQELEGNELRVLPFPVSDIEKELVQEIVQIKTKDITDEEFLECIGLTCGDTKNESEGECLESTSSKSNLVINEDTVMRILNKDNQDKALVLADFIESDKLVVDYEAHITRKPEIQTVDVAVPFAAKKRKLDADASHRYKCGVCFARFSEKIKIKHHMATHDKDEKCYCNCNGFSIPMSLSELQIHKHTQQYRIGKSFKCEECGQAFSTRTSLDEHSAQKSHRCPVCTSLTFPSCIHVKLHQVTHHSDSFSCTRCGKSFRILVNYRSHCTSCEYCACEICDRSFKSGEFLKKHVEIQHLNVNDVFNCHLCDRNFDSSDYDTHDCTAPLALRLPRVKLPMSVSEEPIKYSCSGAVESIDTTVVPDTSEPDLTTFNKLSKSPKKRHSQGVEGVYPCEHCDRIYPWLSSLRRHVNVTHKNTKSYWCVKCLKVFRVKCSLDIHKCTTNKKFKRGIPVRCPVCLSRHHTAVALSKHIIQYHQELEGNSKVLEDFNDTVEESSIDKNVPVEPVVDAEPVANVEPVVNTEMRAAELFHMLTEDFKDDLIRLNPYVQIEVKDEPKSPEPEPYESLDDYLRSTDRIDRIKICVDESLRNSETEIMEKTEIIQVIREEKESAEEDELFSEQPNESLQLTPNNEEKADKNCIKYNFIYSCVRCNYSKNSFSKYIEHWANHGFDPSECPQCQKKIKTRSDMELHVNSHIRSMFKKSRVYKVKSRTDMSSQSNSYSCKMCNVYVLKPCRYRHWENHFMSPVRHSVLSNLKKLNLLEKLAATESAMDSEIDIKVEILSDDELDDVSPPATAAYKLEKICTLCNKRFDRVQCLKRHLIEHIVNSIKLKKDPHGEFRCRLCENVSFGKVQMFKRHLRQHADLPMYDCNFCNKSFADSSNYAKHKKVHGLPHMQCDLCKRKFNRKRMLIEHMQYHEKNEPLPCPFCKKVFHFSSNLKKHIRIIHFNVNHTKLTLYPCKHCTLRFGTLKEKRIHQWNAHGVRKNKNDCPVCQSGYRTLSDLRRHLRHLHNIGVKSCDLRNLINTGSVNQLRKNGTINIRKLFTSKKK